MESEVAASKLARRVLLIVAHPDDETMFFSPLLSALFESAHALAAESHLTPSLLPREAASETHILCLSNGNYEGLGRLRATEMRAACEIAHGIPPSRVTVLDLPELKDGPNLWRDDFVASAVTRHLSVQHFDIVITFDRHGVSQHPNHISCFYGLKRLFDSIMNGRTSDHNRLHLPLFDKVNNCGSAKDIELWVLDSAPIYLKYLGVLYPIFIAYIVPLFLHAMRLFYAPRGPTASSHSATTDDCSSLMQLLLLASKRSWTLMYRSGKKGTEVFHIWGLFNAFKGMKLHSSQLVWYRYLYLLFSSYTTFNRLVRVRQAQH